jgi:hypothetical protein
VGVNTTVWNDDFTSAGGSPWSTVSISGGGDVRVEDGFLWMEGPDAAGEWTSVEWGFDTPGLELSFDFFVDVNGPGGFELRLTTESGKAFILTRDTGTDLLWLVWDGLEQHVIYDIGRFWMGSWYDDGSIRIHQDGDLYFGGGGLYAGGYHYFGEDFTGLQLRCGQGFDLHVDRMVLLRNRLTGTVVSETVALPPGMLWTKARVDGNLDTARLDVLDADTLLPVPGYGDLSDPDLAIEDRAYVLDLRGIDPRLHPALMLRYRIHAFDTNSPVLFFWQLWWEPGSIVIMDAFDDGSGVEGTEDVGVFDGRLTTPNVLLTDDFTRYDISPWYVEEGVADTLEGALWTQSREAQETSVALDLTEGNPDGVSLRTFVYRMGDKGPGIELRGEDGRSYAVGYDKSRSLLGVTYDNLMLETIIWSTSFEWETNEWVEVDIRYGSSAIELRIGPDAFTVPISNYFPLLSLVLHSGDAREVFWDDLVVSRDEITGSAFTDHITLPEGEGWLWLEVEHGAPGNASLDMRLVDAESGVTIPGFGTMEATLYDISGIDTGEHPVLQLRFDLSGEYGDVPYVDWYRIFWTGMVESILQTREFEDIQVHEDSPVTDVLNVTDYFTSTFTEPMDLMYMVTDVSDPRNVLPHLEGWMLAIDLPGEDWYGTATFRLRVSTGEVELTTVPINIIVLPVDDPPAFRQVERVVVTEDELKHVHLLGWLFDDVDTEPTDLTLEVLDANATVDVMAVDLLFGTGGFERDLPVRVSDATSTVDGVLPVRVVAVDDAPVISWIGKVYMNEDELFHLDLSPYVSDEDTAVGDLSVIVGEPNCTVDGLVLTFYFWDVPEGGLDLRVPLKVSDGTSTVNSSFRLQVNDIPDLTFAPEVGEVATQRFSVGVERTVDLGPYVTDVDTPLEGLTVQCDHPAVVSCQGLRVTLVFSEATGDPVTVQFTVSDGTYTVPGSFDAVVSEDEEPEPTQWWTEGSGLLLVVIIVTVGAFVAAAAYLGTRAD